MRVSQNSCAMVRTETRVVNVGIVRYDSCGTTCDLLADGPRHSEVDVVLVAIPAFGDSLGAVLEKDDGCRSAELHGLDLDVIHLFSNGGAAGNPTALLLYSLSTASMRSPSQRMTGTAMLLPHAL